MWRNSATGLLLLLLLACGGPVGPEAQTVQLFTDDEAYTLGDPASVTLINAGPHAVGPGNVASTLLCRSRLELEQGDDWQAMSPLVDGCVLVGAPPLDAGRQVDLTFWITEELFPTPGLYRIRAIVTVDPGGEDLTILSNAFRVTT